jgi:glyoxylase-like metal-dependent hydrolase (beta-lactamase superfamily II)/rhodanese-related sulfurtransferase
VKETILKAEPVGVRVNIICEQLNPHACRTYLLGLQGAKDRVLIDPVLEHVNDYIRLLEKSGSQLTHVIDTHSHADHISGAPALKDILGCPYVMHDNAPSRCADFRVSDGSELEMYLSIPLEVLFTPGHTNDSICLVCGDIVFTGDTLFLDDGGAGRDDLPGGDPGAHWESLKRLALLPDELIVYPAHNYRDSEPSSLKVQKKTNLHLKNRSRKEYVQYIEDLKLGPAAWMKDVLQANYACAREPGAAWIPVDAPACEVKGTLEVGVNEIQVLHISVQDLRKRLRSDDPPVLLDVREREELYGELGHIEGIVHIPIGSLSGRISKIAEHRKREVVTVCRSGARASTAAQILTKSGFSSVKVLRGGMIEWNAQRLSKEG